MSRRHEPPTSVRPERTLSRVGLWATGPMQPTQLQLPFEATGLSERITATGRLKLTPDFDVFAWLCERWLTRPTASGWMRPTLYELGSSLYGKAPSGENYRDLRAALDRLAWVNVSIDGYAIETGTFDDSVVSRDNLLALQRAKGDPSGLQRPSIRLAEWLRVALAEEKVVRVHWQTLRAFHERQQLAKRLWLYLAAERWKRGAPDREGVWIACGDRLEAALGMRYERPRAARAALKRACETIRRLDLRYAAGHLEVVQVGRGWRVSAERPTWDAWKLMRDDQAAARAVVRESIAGAQAAAAATSATPTDVELSDRWAAIVAAAAATALGAEEAGVWLAPLRPVLLDAGRLTVTGSRELVDGVSRRLRRVLEAAVDAAELGDVDAVQVVAEKVAAGQIAERDQPWPLSGDRLPFFDAAA